MHPDGRAKIRVVATLGPASLRPDVLRGLEERAVSALRINLAHTALDSLARTVEFVREHTALPITLDTEGAQVRSGMMLPGSTLQAGQAVRLTPDKVVGTAERISLRPAAVFAALRAGSVLRIGSPPPESEEESPGGTGAVLRVGHVDNNGATAMVIQGGSITPNLPVSVDPAPVLAPLTGKDRRAIEVAAGLGIRTYGLAFAADAVDIDHLRTQTPAGSTIVARIESRAGVWNPEEILDAADAVVVDRGNLARHVPLEYVPFYQKAIVRAAGRTNTPVSVATNLLESMIAHRQASVAEVNDIANALLDGAQGLVLSSETAVGTDPLAVVDTISKLVRAFERSNLAVPAEGDWAFAAS